MLHNVLHPLFVIFHPVLIIQSPRFLPPCCYLEVYCQVSNPCEEYAFPCVGNANHDKFVLLSDNVYSIQVPLTRLRRGKNNIREAWCVSAFHLCMKNYILMYNIIIFYSITLIFDCDI